MSEFVFPPTPELVRVVTDLSFPLPQRMRSVFYLRTVGGADAVAALCTALTNKEGTTLFRHEIAYVLGQMEAKDSIPTLVAVLQDGGDDPIVRHECGEALGAIADPAALPVLEALSADATPEVAETCQIAAARVRWVLEHGAQSEAGAWRSPVGEKAVVVGDCATPWRCGGAPFPMTRPNAQHSSRITPSRQRRWRQTILVPEGNGEPPTHTHCGQRMSLLLLTTRL
jgi:hypothetical protein